MLPLLGGTAGAQQAPEADPAQEIPWFKVEVIVFRDLREIPDDEVFTPPPEEITSSAAGDEQAGVIDTRALGQASSLEAEAEPEPEPVPLQATVTDETEVPVFGDTLPSTDPGQEPETELPPSENDSIVPGSRFRLVAIENLFPDELPGDEAPPPATQEPDPVDPKAGMSPEEAADFALMNELELTRESKRLRDSSNYETLAHMAWIQPGYAREDAIAFPLAELAGPGSGLHGDLTLHLSRYLHLQFDLAIDETPKTPGEENLAAIEALVALPGAWGDNGAGELAPEYRINEKRRMRSGELHYIDHPRFGVLARISKVKPELVQPDSEQADQFE